MLEFDKTITINHNLIAAIPQSANIFHTTQHDTLALAQPHRMKVDINMPDFLVAAFNVSQATYYWIGGA